jgi:hypothetical protein
MSEWAFKSPAHLAAWSCTFEPYPERPDLWEPGQVAPDDDGDTADPVIVPVSADEVAAFVKLFEKGFDV